MSSKYSLEIINKEDNRQFKKYDIDGEKVIGVYENEPFVIKFKNNTYNKVQVRISVDGTDVLTGNLAHTEATPDGMWVVNAYGSMELKAWPETNEGGAELLFGKTKDSVAANTHGDLSAKGLIAIAVFEEEQIGFLKFGVPFVIKPTPEWTTYDRETRISDHLSYETKCCSADKRRGGSVLRKSGLNGRSLSLNDTYCTDTIKDICEAGPAVGAGDYTEQTITKTAGLNRPKFAEVVQIKYEWWTSLRSKIRNQEEAETHSAFPGDKKNFINLGQTPRMETDKGIIRRENVEQKRRGFRNRRRFVPEQKHIEYTRFI
jgi:hypothetical protein